jgi:L-lactate dehydrogenase complex protein LldF
MIDLPRLLLELRKEEAEGRPPTTSWLERVSFGLIGWGLRQPWMYNLAARIGQYAQRPFARDGRISSAPFPLSQWTRARDFPMLDPKSFRERWRSK